MPHHWCVVSMPCHLMIMSSPYYTNITLSVFCYGRPIQLNTISTHLGIMSRHAANMLRRFFVYKYSSMSTARNSLIQPSELDQCRVNEYVRLSKWQQDHLKPESAKWVSNNRSKSSVVQAIHVPHYFNWNLSKQKPLQHFACINRSLVSLLK